METTLSGPLSESTSMSPVIKKPVNGKERFVRYIWQDGERSIPVYDENGRMNFLILTTGEAYPVTDDKAESGKIHSSLADRLVKLGYCENV